MGGRGSRSGGFGVGGGGFGAAGGVGGALFGTPQAVTPPPVQNGQPVPAITIQQLQSMNDQEFATYMNGLKSTPIDPLTYYNNDWDTQRLVANMPELNRAPQIADAQTFAAMKGETIYRTVNASGADTAVDICARTMTSDVTTIGEGRMGDGFYFANSLSGSQAYGYSRNNINRTATMTAKLNSNARVVSESRLNQMLSNEKPAVRNAVRRMSSGGSWSGDSGLMAYALYKGYNVVNSSSYYNVIDRNAVTFSGDLAVMR